MSELDRATGERIRRYQHDHRTATPHRAPGKEGGKNYGHAYVHTVVDDHSRVAYAETHDDETAATVARGVPVEHVLTALVPAAVGGGTDSRGTSSGAASTGSSRRAGPPPRT